MTIIWRLRLTSEKKRISSSSRETRIRKKKTTSGKKKPAKFSYIEEERGTYLKKWTGRNPVALCYPNEYKVGMSSLGFQLVYTLLNSVEGVVCERFFLPKRGQRLLSVESSRSIDQFPLVFLSISFEHDYLNVVRFLQLAGIPRKAEDRDDDISSGQPLIICGGVATFMNPEPLAPFVDLFYLGEAEHSLSEIYNFIQENYRQYDRPTLLRKVVTTFEGCYAPIFYTPIYDGHQLQVIVEDGVPERVKRLVQSETKVAGHSQLLSPNTEFSNLFLTELGRGCSRGCRFCTAGFIYRPPRLWDGDAVVEGLKKKFSGIERVGLLGMEMAGSDTLGKITEYLMESGCSLSFSSLRADRIDNGLLQLLGKSELKSVAIAPDGASERLRRVINKGLDEKSILSAAEKLVSIGIYKLKIYLMIGLPTETEEDLQEALELVHRIKAVIDPIGREKGRLCEILLSVNCFVPKPWTPFQFHPFGLSSPIGEGEEGDWQSVVGDLKRKIKYLRNGIASISNVHFNCDKPENVMFQAVLARGDRRLGDVLIQMVENSLGWKQALKVCNIRPEQFAVRGYGEKQYLPWNIVDHGIKQSYLFAEYKRSFEGKLSEACDTTICKRCGVCNG